MVKLQRTGMIKYFYYPAISYLKMEDAIKGAEQGKAFALANKNSLTELNKINDYDWLEEQWKQSN